MSFQSPFVDGSGFGASGVSFGPPGPPTQNNASLPPGRYAGFDPRFLNALVQNAYSSTISRGMFRRQLADERRDIPRECGYPQDITIDLYANLYEREPYAARVVQLMPKECWQVQPTVYEDETSETKTPFEEAWDNLGNQLRPERSYHRQEEGSLLWNYLLRADVLSGVGSYGAIVLGLDDGLPLDRPIAERREGAQLRYLRVLPESLAPISRFVNDEKDPRNGLPETYSCTFQDTKAPISGSGVASATGTTTTREVHWTRVIHVADNLEASEWAGVPRMRTPFDPLLDIVKTRSASNEGFWRAVVSILSLETDPALGGDVDVNPAKVRQMLEQFYGGMQRDLILNGMTAKTIAPTVSDPTPHIAACVESICVLMGVPVRVFKGSERGELASSQDDDAWNDRLSMRQQTYLTPSLVVPFVDRLISVGVLPEPEGYSVAWPDVASRSPAERGTTAATRTTAMSTYVSGGVEALMAPHDFLTRELGYDEDEADAIIESVTESQTEKMEEQQAQADELGMKVQPPPGMIDPEQQKAEQEAALELAKAGGGAKGPPPPGAKGSKPGQPGKGKPPFGGAKKGGSGGK